MNAVAERVERRNITPFDEIVIEIDDLYEQIAGVTAIENEKQHEAASGLYDALHSAGKRAEELRKEEVAPLDEAKSAIQDRYHPLIGDTKKGKGKVVRGKEVLGEVLAAWRTEQERLKREAAEEARREAEEEKRRAQEAMRASAGDLEARERAEEQLALAKEADAFANRQEKRAVTGNGLRTYAKAAVTDLNAAVRHYWTTHKARFEALVCDLATEDARRGIREIPGITVTEEKRAI